MPDHLRFAGLDFDAQRNALETLVLANDGLMHVLVQLRNAALPEALIGGGAIYQTVWNSLTGRALWQGVKDIDIAYFDASDLSWEAEDRVIRDFESLVAAPPAPIEVRNQARVHLWYAQKFGFEIAPLPSSRAALKRYAALVHAVAVRLEPDDSLHVEAPFGASKIFLHSASYRTPRTQAARPMSRRGSGRFYIGRR